VRRLGKTKHKESSRRTSEAWSGAHASCSGIKEIHLEVLNCGII